jgi:hypothetical protein
MKILAVVSLNGRQVTQAWDVIRDVRGRPILVVEELPNGDIKGIALDDSKIMELNDLESAELRYPEILNGEDTELIPLES